jgi:hypothetical protein
MRIPRRLRAAAPKTELSYIMVNGQIFDLNKSTVIELQGPAYGFEKSKPGFKIHFPEQAWAIVTPTSVNYLKVWAYAEKRLGRKPIL